jgi:hypothetical protein
VRDNKNELLKATSLLAAQKIKRQKDLDQKISESFSTFTTRRTSNRERIGSVSSTFCAKVFPESYL